MKTLIVFALLFSGNLFARYSAVDDGACSAKLADSKLEVEEATCIGKDCSCYTKVFRDQIEGLASKRTQQVEDGLEETYIDKAVQQMQSLLDFDLLSSLGSGNLGGGTLPVDCSFDSLKTVLSCKSPKAKKITKEIQKKFFELSDYYVEESQKQAIQGKSVCLSPLEERGIALIRDQELNQARLFRSMKNISDKDWEILLSAQNPFESLINSENKKLKKVANSIENLLLIKAVFSDKETLRKFYETYKEDKTGKFLNKFYKDQKVIGKVREVATEKCKMIFKSIDKLACQKTANYYVTDEKFNNKVFSYYPSASDDQKENNLENHLYYCESKRCLKSKCDEAVGYYPQEFIESLNIGGPVQLSTDDSDRISEILCPSLVCPMDTKNISDFAVGKVVKSCEPLAKEKRNPVELYASLGCPGGESCDTPFADNLRIYASFWKASYRPIEVADDESKPSDEQVRLTLRKTKRSDFVEAFVGEVGKDLDAFFAEDRPANELAQKKPKEKQERVVENRSERRVEPNGKTMIPTPVNTNFTGAGRGFGSSVPTGFEATQIPVSVEDDEPRVDTKIVRDAIEAAKDSIEEAKKWQQAYRDSVKRNDNEQKVVSNTTPNRERKGPASSGDTTIVNNNVVEAPSSTQPLLPAEVTTEYQGEWNKYPEASGADKGRAPASKTPSLVIDRSKLAELNKSLLDEFKIDPLSPFVLKVWIKEGNEKKLVEIPVENLFYNGKMILKPVKDEINSEIYAEVLNSPIFFDYRNMLSEREERRRFFKDVLPNVKKL
jgi:hypothetical protein